MTRSWCDFVHGLTHARLPDDIRATLRRSLVDTIGVAAVGRRSRISALAMRFANAQMAAGAQAPSARLLFDGRRVSPTGAAMAGAFTIDSIDAHDGHSGCKGHAGSAVFPALFAFTDDLAGRGRRPHGRELLAAMAVGYEVSYRAGLAQHATCPDYHTSGAWTAVGVAAMGARLLGLDEEQTRHAVGIAEYHGPRSQMMRCIDHPTMLRDGVGWGAAAGVSAVYLAADGFTGAPAATIEADDAAPFWSDLGERWEIRNTHYKPYPVCRWAHPAIDAAAHLMREHGLRPADVARVRINTFHYATRLGGHAPANEDEFTYGLAFPVATMIARGRIGPDELAPQTLHDAEILRISRNTELVESEHYTRISVGRRWADVVLVLRDGREFQSEPCTPRGDPDNPLGDDELTAKYHGFAEPVLGAPRAELLAALANDIDGAHGDVAELLDALLAPVAEASGEAAVQGALANLA